MQKQEKIRIRQTKNTALVDSLRKQVMADEIELDQNIWWVAYLDGEPVGFAGAAPSDTWSNACYLSLCGVLEEARGRGIQKKLIRARLKWAKSKDYMWALTDTYFNPASGNSLISCGFKLYRPSYMYRGSETNYWKKLLK